MVLNGCLGISLMWTLLFDEKLWLVNVVR